MKKQDTQLQTFQRVLKEDEEEEDVSESGRLFVRNLPYTCTEQELTDIFTKHGADFFLIPEFPCPRFPDSILIHLICFKYTVTAYSLFCIHCN
uniref:RRM domain-containing protein n=2 Tax=Anguilla anguilla TaxID=7936 RepID=A0A0E9RPY0_ANGAN